MRFAIAESLWHQCLAACCVQEASLCVRNLCDTICFCLCVHACVCVWGCVCVCVFVSLLLHLQLWLHAVTQQLPSYVFALNASRFQWLLARITY